MNPVDPKNPSSAGLPGGEDLDRLLKSAAGPDVAEAPAGFVGSVMETIAREETILQGGPSRPSSWRKWAPLGVATAAALLLGAFLLGKMSGTGGGASTDREARRNPAPDVKNPREGAGPRDPSAEEIAEEMRRGARAPANGSQGSAKGDAKEAGGGEKLDRDRARLSISAPGTLAGRFPRSADGRFYVVIGLPLAEVPALAAFVSQENAPPRKPDGAPSPPESRAAALAGYAVHPLTLSAAEAEKLLAKLEAAHPGALQPHMLGFEGIAPVNGVVTPPRIESSADAKNGHEGGEAASRAAKSAAQADAIDLLIYTRDH